MNNPTINLKILEMLNRNEAEEKARRIRLLLAKADIAIGWGVPDVYSIGYTQHDLVEIIRELRSALAEVSGR